MPLKINLYKFVGEDNTNFSYSKHETGINYKKICSYETCAWLTLFYLMVSVTNNLLIIIKGTIV